MRTQRLQATIRILAEDILHNPELAFESSTLIQKLLNKFWGQHPAYTQLFSPRQNYPA